MFGIPTTAQELMARLLILPVSILSLSVHEWAHAWSAFRLGDDTAAREGRLTLNPMSHIDVLGTIILPVLGFPLGWAKPVPVNPLRFRRDVTMKAGMMITAVAGPLSNALIAIVSTVLLGLVYRFHLESAASGAYATLLRLAIMLNVGLCLFNLIPIPPLDGSRVADGLMPYRLRPQWEQFSRYGMVALFAFLWLSKGTLGRAINFVTEPLARLVYVIAG